MANSIETEISSRFRELHGLLGIILRAFLIAIPVLGISYILGVHNYFHIVLWREQYLGLFISLVLASVFLGVPSTKRASCNAVPWYDLLFAAASLAPGIYIAIFYPESLMAGLKATPDKVILGGILILLALEAARRFLGWIFVSITSLFILYGAFTDFFPGFLWGKPTPWPRLITHLFLDATSFLYLVGIAATLVLAFIVFGQLLFSFGGGKFLCELALSLMGSSKGGAAKAAVIGSTLFGTISGSALSNILVTGSVTIPLMKRTGYPAHIASAIETAASNGGMLMPPIMGITAFIMADMIGIPYFSVAIAALIPALLYYFALFTQVHLEAGKMGMKGLPRQELQALIPLLKKGWVILVPPLFLIYLLTVRRTPPETAAIYSFFFGLLFLALLRENRHQFWRRLLLVMESSSEILINAATMLICAGFILAIVGITGLGFKLSLALVTIGGDYSLLLLLVAGGAAMIMGMGLPASACYILVAALVAPALVKSGMDLMASHLFVLYYGNLALITPPIALGAFVAAGIGQAAPMATGFSAMRLSVLAYIVPFLFVYSPSLLLRGPVWRILTDVVTAGTATWVLGVVLIGYWVNRLSWFKRAFAFFGSLALFSSLIAKPMPDGLLLKAVGFIATFALLAETWLRRRARG